MVFSIFGKKQQAQQTSAPTGGRFVRPMQLSDINAVVDIIEEHDEDDAMEARESFREGVDDMFVAEDNGRVVGVTGSFDDPESDDIVWLSWTYVAEDQRRQGMGRYLLEGLLTHLQQNDVRKIFMSTGEYIEDGEDIYAAAKGLYENQGARLEMKMDDYFEPGEARFVYGLDLQEGADQEAEPPLDGDLVFDGLFEAPETDEGLVLTWREYEDSDASGEHPRDKLTRLLDEARGEDVRFVIAAIPADLATGAAKGLKAMGFSQEGELKDYYQPGVSQQHWRLMLDAVS